MATDRDEVSCDFCNKPIYKLGDIWTMKDSPRVACPKCASERRDDIYNPDDKPIFVRSGDDG